MASRERGLTLLELVLTTAIMAILAASAMPLFQVSVRRGREIELRRGLRQIRMGLDEFHKSYVASGGTTSQGRVTLPGSASETGEQPGGQVTDPRTRRRRPRRSVGSQAQQKPPDVALIDVSDFDPVDSKGYPPNLKILVEGVQASGTSGDENLVKFLRRIPIDPMIDPTRIQDNDENFGWAARSYQDSLESTAWGRQNVYDVYSTSSGTALDGTKYKDW